MTTTYQVIAPATPGARPTVIGEARKIADARRLAKPYEARKDLTYQDVRIAKAGRHVEYCGPAR
jgi:hypothetical protein